MMINVESSCPCCSKQSYKMCCQTFHNGDSTVSSAEQLMRSRYSAFVVGDSSYLIKTLHPDKRQSDDDSLLRQTIEHTNWLGLKIIAHKSSGNNSTVEFVAFYQDDPIGQLHERSHFITHNDQWFYVDGEMLPSIKLSRNNLCFCGSGKKVKRCHNV